MTIFLLVFQFGKGEQFPLQIAVAIHRGQRRQLVDWFSRSYAYLYLQVSDSYSILRKFPL